MDENLRREIKDILLGYGSGEDFDKIGLMITIPCNFCYGKGHNESYRTLDQTVSLDDVKCRECKGKGYELKPVNMEKFLSLFLILFEKDYNIHWQLSEIIKNDYDIQEALMETISKNSLKIIDTLKTALVSDVMET